MQFFNELVNNTLIMVTALAWLAAQTLKVILHLAVTGKLSPERFIGSGGTPSSHSATVCALTTATYLEYGASGFEFAVSLLLALVVMQDAMVVRRETGIQARLLNHIIIVLKNHQKHQVVEHNELKELIGHTPFQVFAGAVLGIITALLYLS